MTAVFSPLSSDLYSIPKGQILFRKAGAKSFALLGDADNFSLEVAVERDERYSNEYGTRTLVDTIITQTSATVSMTLLQMSGLIRALSVLGEDSTMTQTATTAQTIDITGVKAGGIVKTPHLAISNVVITGMDAGDDYRVNGPTGTIEFLIDVPGGTTSATYDAAAVTSGHQSGVASGTGLRGTLMFVGTNSKGPKALLMLHDVQLTPAGARAFLSDTDRSSIELTGTAFPIAGQPAGFAIGYEQTIA
ncbi:MAG: hypothetical protein ACT6Q8_24245 [Niveispirillum sp.]|uniref:phage tail tube protein n=1 Tax=Niveispirillum sp. TaxID=1917217 RepID=UPI0040353564